MPLEISKFSVLMPVYWKESPIRFANALASIYSNTIVPNETLLICDGPLTLELDDVINYYLSEKGFRVVRLKTNQGIVSALNTGLTLVRNEIVIRCDSDDINRYDRFEKLVSKINEGFDIVGSQVNEINSDGVVVARKRLPLFHSQIVQYAKKRNPINHMSVAFKASDIIKVGGYPNVYLKEDYALWAILMGSKKIFCNLDEPLVDANGGISMYARRGGIRSALSEIKLQKILVKARVSSLLTATMIGMLRVFILILPTYVRSIFYRFLLRSK